MRALFPHAAASGFVVLLAAACADPADDPRPEPVGDEPRGELEPAPTYRAEFPGPVEKRTSVVPVGGLRIEQHTEMFEDESMAIGVQWIDYPPDAEMKSRAALYDATLDGAARAVSLRDAERRSVTVDGRPGQELVGHGAGGHSYRARVVLVGRRMFTLIVTTSADKLDAPVVQRFLRSFRIVTR